MEKEKNNPTPEVKDEQLDEVAGGVQAGCILHGGDGEFGPKPKPQPEPKPYHPYL